MPVELFAIELDQPDDAVAALASTLDRPERATADSRRGQARPRYIAAHGAVRALLAARLGVDPSDLVIDRSCKLCGHPAHGKPRVEAAPALSFSLSHSGDCAVVAIASDAGAIGVDVEICRPRRHLDRLAARIMNDAEIDIWNATPPEERLGIFLRAWTAKEALLKATGHGLVRPMRSLSSQPSGWTIASFAPASGGRGGAVGAVAVEGEHDLDLEVARWVPATGVTLPGAC